MATTTKSESQPPEKVVVALCKVLVRAGVDQVLTAQGHTVVHADPVATDVLRAVRSHQPHVLVGCADGCGMTAALGEFRATEAPIGLVVLGPGAEAQEDISAVRQLLRYGYEGFCYLSMSSIQTYAQFSAAVQQVAMGAVIIDSSLAELLTRDDPERQTDDTQLSERGWEILAMVALGYRKTAIAGAMVVTERAVEKHLNAVYRKLGLGHAEGPASAGYRGQVLPVHPRPAARHGAAGPGTTQRRWTPAFVIAAH